MIESLILLVLIFINGFLALSEIAVVSARRLRLQHMAEEGRAGAKTALELAESPSQFLSTVQVGITLIGVLAGAFGSAAIADDLAAQIEKIEILAPYSRSVAIGLIVMLTTYLSLIIGELVPKQLAIKNPEKFAMLVARPMKTLAWISTPAVKVLSASTDFILRVIGADEHQNEPVTEAEVLALIQQGIETGIFEETEHEMIEGVLGLADQRVTEVMTFRTEIVWLDVDAPFDEIKRKIVEQPYQFYPVCRESIENVLGVVRAKDLLVHLLNHQSFDLKVIMQPPLFVPESNRVAKVLEVFKTNHTEIALVVGEHGGVEGVVTIDDLMGEVFGALNLEDPEAVLREDGSWLLDGMLPFDELEDILPEFPFPTPENRAYDTLAGFVLTQLGRIPDATDYFDQDGMRFEVMDMDGKRIDKVLVKRLD